MNANEGSSTSISSFITTTYDMVDDSSSDLIISWSESGKSFIIWNPDEFYNNLFQRFCFTDNNLISFFSSLNKHGFEKVDSEKWEFANDNFVRGQPHLIKNIINYIIEQNVLVQQRSDMLNMEKIFKQQVKGVKYQLPPYKRNPSSKLPFPTKIYEMVDDPSSDGIISWSESGKSFIIWNPQEFYKDLLRRFTIPLPIFIFFCKLESFGFRKINPDMWEFANDNFVQNQPQLIENIIRKHVEKMDQQGKDYARKKNVREAGDLFKLQVEEMVDMRKKMRKLPKEVKGQEVGLCKL
ncbi:hypothetical protein CARUB_v10007111mg [Capsella rubella]|uniref:HSF-type DNA-binding domain-containing protein n=1 Tax=Capsella rubella TaxID=81985 RepID=R0H4X1_9BRAS|nr:heat stress transcription factor A-4a [Capsella rubella]EOA18553.1 hypothetical protein CARUB_v10007111mg [Capsella rubella]